MPRDSRALTRAVRARAAAKGEAYTVAREAVIAIRDLMAANGWTHDEAETWYDSGGSGQPPPGAEPMAAACRRATADNYGSTLVGDPVVSPAGVRVRLSSWPRQQEALRALRALGYRVAEDSRAGEHGAALLVTGWSAELLTARVERLETAARDLERDIPAWAGHALDRFRGLVCEDGVDDATAQDQVGAEILAAAAAQPGPRHLHAAAGVHERDRRQATGKIRSLLDRAASGELAVTRLSRGIEDLAGSVIGLFLEYRDAYGHDEETAAARALLEILEGTQAVRELAGYDVEWAALGNTQVRILPRQ